MVRSTSSCPPRVKQRLIRIPLVGLCTGREAPISRLLREVTPTSCICCPRATSILLDVEPHPTVGEANAYRMLLEIMRNAGVRKPRESKPRERGVRTKMDAANPLKLLADRVRQARARRGMTRKQLARDSGV